MEWKTQRLGRILLLSANSLHLLLLDVKQVIKLGGMSAFLAHLEASKDQSEASEATRVLAKDRPTRTKKTPAWVKESVVTFAGW
jgi:hypothetical protein